MKKLLTILMLLAFMGSMTFVQAQGAQGKKSDLTAKVPVDKKVKIGKLANGMTYYIRANKKPENRVQFRLVTNAGSILEDDDQQGLAHFCEHMAFNGTQYYKGNEMISTLQKNGIEFGRGINAWTAFDETVGKVTGLVEAYGGWIESSSVSGSNYYQKSRGTAAARNASYSLRIPSARFSELMDRLSDLGNIPYSHTYTENVTSQYYDAQARLKAYTTQEERLLEMMELAESVEDVIIIEDRLTELRYKIESIQSNLNNWDRRVSYSTVFLTVQEVKEYTPEEKVNPTYGEELRRALKDGLRNAGEFLKNLLVFLIELLPVLLILIPLLWLAVWLIRKIISGSKVRSAKRAERKQRKLEEKLAKARAKQDLTASPAAQPAEKAEAPSQQKPSAEEAEEKSKG